MKFMTGKKQTGEIFIGVITHAADEQAIDLTKASKGLGLPFPESLLDALKSSDDFLKKVQKILGELHDQGLADTHVEKLESVQLLAPIPRPLKNIFCVGKNYLEHALELGSAEDVPEVPMFFSKAPTSVVGPEEAIRIPVDVTTDIDYEGELAVVIGKTGKRIKAEDAFDHIFGYTLLNDVTARDLQKKHKQFLLGKSMDTSCPLGPVIVHKNSIPDPQDLTLTTYVNDEVRQQSSTSKMIFPIEELIVELSKVMTLEAGDIIATGTPAGVGKGFQPPKYLREGDTVTIEIEQIGTLRNPVQNDV